MNIGQALLGTGSMPCLRVPDLDTAVEHYRATLGFEDVELLTDPHRVAVVRRAGAGLLLQESDHPDRPGGWDAVFFVQRVDQAMADLRRRGATIQFGTGISALSARTMEARDPWGNVLAFCELESGLAHSARQLARRALPTRARIALRDARHAREERPHLREFAQFYRGLADHRDVFYMFFTGGLLHWVVSAIRHVPADVNLVLLGSDLPEEDETWLRRNVNRPLHVVRLGIDDNTMWEFLFEVNEHNFGWIDIDCFVLKPKLFADMTRLEDGVAVNGVWTYEAAPSVPISCTHFAFLDVGVIRELRRAQQPISPTNYDYRGMNVFLHPRTNCRILTGPQQSRLLRVLPPDEHGRPLPPGDGPFFDTLVAYQIDAAAAGYRTHAVRPLAHRSEASLQVEEGADRLWQQDMTDEVVHVGGVSYYQRYFHGVDLRAMYAAAEHMLLSRLVDRLPRTYSMMLAGRRADLEHLGVRSEDAENLILRHLVVDRGISPESAARVIGG
ncbi:hypothetical protein SAMN05216188_12950 [Lentzea xinjiangensis]|uniref:VOC domain-containing protein n=1 Tax=Lentzea xinjiangensis TaxID=402600 RepID=A0A1H9W126_9PSEU|nr:VOC family protein [Lentzea xinjiangensis]SES27223.1 hypothetical protein SAMN05216188_12950 [Lentzea xinjiangensis]